MLKIDTFEKKETREFKKENDNLESNKRFESKLKKQERFR